MELSDSLNNHTNDDDIIHETFNCPVCLSDKSEEEKCITECGHEFCKNCIHTWFNRSKITCPSCRSEIKVYTNHILKNVQK